MIEQWMQNRRLIAHYYVTIGLAALLFAWLARNDETMDTTILVILTVYVLLFPVVILYTRNSYYHYSVEPHYPYLLGIHRKRDRR